MEYSVLRIDFLSLLVILDMQVSNKPHSLVYYVKKSIQMVIILNTCGIINQFYEKQKLFQTIKSIFCETQI